MKDLIKRVVDITYKEKLSHLCSCLSSLPIIKEIYDKKEEDEVFIVDDVVDVLEDLDLGKTGEI